MKRIPFSEVDSYSTDELVAAILTVALSESCNIAILVPRGQGHAYVARISMHISRSRDRVAAKGGVPMRFILRRSIHPETHNGTTYDCVKFWVKKSNKNLMQEIFQGKEL